MHGSGVAGRQRTRGAWPTTAKVQVVVVDTKRAPARYGQGSVSAAVRRAVGTAVDLFCANDMRLAVPVGMQCLGGGSLMWPGHA